MEKQKTMPRLNYENGFLKCGKAEEFYVDHAGLLPQEAFSHFSLPPRIDQINICKAFIKKWIVPSKHINYAGYNSYALKHAVESVTAFETGDHTLHIFHGAFIQAAIELGYRFEPIDGLKTGINAAFNMKFEKLTQVKDKNGLKFA